MRQVQRIFARRMVGRDVRVACSNGDRVVGRLLSFNGDSLWIVAGDEDRFIRVDEVVALGPGRI